MDCNNGMNLVKYFKGFNPLPFHVKKQRKHVFGGMKMEMINIRGTGLIMTVLKL